MSKLTLTVGRQDISNSVFEVISFDGHEAISEDYEFKIKVRTSSSVSSIDILNQYGTLTIEVNKSFSEVRISKYNGIISEFINSEKKLEYYYYDVVLVPNLTRLKYSHKSDVYIDSSLSEILNSIFRANLFTKGDVLLDFDINGSNYKSGEKIDNRYSLVCRYKESCFDFILRLLARDGVSFYFEQGDQQEKLIITDGKFKLFRKDKLHFRLVEQEGMNLDPDEISFIQCKHKIVAGKVTVMNFGYEKAHLGDNGVISCTVEVSSLDKNVNAKLLYGEKIIYGEHFVDPSKNGDGEFLAKIRAQEVYCKSKVFIANSTAIPIYAGMVIAIEDYKAPEFNGQYLVLEVSHRGYNLLNSNEKVVNQPPFYENTLVLIPADVQFRPQQNIPWPRIYGTMNALIDGESNQSKLPPIDDKGRYKVRLPFLNTPKDSGKGSTWLRLATPYAGHQFGFHFPLHKGTEVVLSFRDGNPDLPVIMGAVFNSLHENIVVKENAHMGGIIITKGGNKLIMNDKEGNTSISMATDNNWQVIQ